MLTFFTTAKPFRGHDAIIQRNALKGWKLLHPHVEVILFGNEHWESLLRRRVLRDGRRRGAEWIDYFVFSRGLFAKGVPPFVVGRVFWDNWLVWKALASNFPVIDVSDAVLAVHQNHDYAYHPQGKDGVFCGIEAGRNYQFAGGWRHLRTIGDATEVLCRDGLKPNRLRHWASAAKPSPTQMEHRIAIRAVLLFEVQKWLLRNDHDLRSRDLRAYLTQWKNAQAQDGFALQAPGRWKYFRHLLGYPLTYGEIMTRRHRVYSYMRACSALVLGYHHLHLFDDARRKPKEWMAFSSEKTLVAIPAKAKAAAATKS